MRRHTSKVEDKLHYDRNRKFQTLREDEAMSGREPSAPSKPTTRNMLLMLPLLLAAAATTTLPVAADTSSGLRFEPETNAYHGLTFTFDPRLDKRVEWLHFEHWLSIMQHSSALLYEALQGRAHLAEVRVLIPYKWRASEWPLLHKPGVPILTNRRLRYAHSDVLVGFEDPVYRGTPYAIQHDECGKQGLRIHMPISFLEQTDEPRLKARQLVREFASHRYGIFKESGFRYDPMYPPFASLPGLSPARTSAPNRHILQEQTSAANQSLREQLAASVRGFDQNWQECQFEAEPGSGLPQPQALNCLPYLTGSNLNTNLNPAASFNLMSADPFSHSNLSSHRPSQEAVRPVEWRQLNTEAVRWHFCGDNFPAAAGSHGENGTTSTVEFNKQQQQQSFQHNQLAANKQNVMCNERSAMDVIKSSDDFRRSPFSPSNFNRLPATNFRFLQEMPPRLILCVEFSAHLYQARRLDHGILEAAIGKFLAFDLIADTEMALVLFGLQHSTRSPFEKLDSSVKSRLALYSPALNPYDEQARFYSEQELASAPFEFQSASSQSAKIVKGSCSFGKALAEASASLAGRSHYDDVGADLVMITSGLFVEDEAKIEELIRSNAQMRSDSVQVNLIIYPSAMLFDTKSRDGYTTLNPLESEQIIRTRINKLLLIQRLLGAKVHLVKEQLDSAGNVKMSTLIQFYQIFEHISRGHSWDQTQSLQMLSQEPQESRASNGSLHKLTYQFEVDDSIQTELIVGFLDPKQQHQHSKSGKRFALKNLQLRSPGGQVTLSDTLPWPHESSQVAVSSFQQDPSEASLVQADLGDASEFSSGKRSIDSLATNSPNHQQQQSSTESALFPYRSQLGLAGFHLKPTHLASLRSARRLAGLWTLTATSDDPVQTSALAMARVNPAGDTITAHCWLQTYSDGTTAESLMDAIHQKSLSRVKVFMQVRAGAQQATPVELEARMAVEDEMGNIVQHVQMLDDGLGVPDMTKQDGIHSQYVQRAHRPGYYKVRVELSGLLNQEQSHKANAAEAALGQDQPCCGSIMPQAASSDATPSTRHLSRQLYCGTFYADHHNKLAQQRPPRVNNLTVVAVDQEQRRVTIRWFEPALELTPLTRAQMHHNQKLVLENNNDLQQQQSVAAEHAESGAIEEPQQPLALVSRLTKTSGSSFAPQHSGQESEDDGSDDVAIDHGFGRVTNQVRGLIVAGGQAKPALSSNEAVAIMANRYEIKLFADRDTLKRAFDAKQEVGFKFSEWNAEGAFPNASAYGGMKEVTLRVPYNREGIYYIAMKVYNSMGLASPLSTIVQFWLRNNLTQDEAESIYGSSSNTVDADGNVYDKNGELIQRAGGQLTYLLPKPSTLDGIGILVFICVIAFVFSVVCISLCACLLSSARKSMKERLSNKHGGSSKRQQVGSAAAIIGATTGASNNVGTSGSSMVSGSGCPSSSSQQSEVASSAGGSQCGGHDIEIGNKLSLVDELSYQQQQQKHRAQLIHNQMISTNHYQQQQYQHVDQQQQIYQKLDPHQLQQQQQAGNKIPWLQHTMVNGYPYATVNGNLQVVDQTGSGLPAAAASNQQLEGDLNENGLAAAVSPVAQSWTPADIMMGHYDKVRGNSTGCDAVGLEGLPTLDTTNGADSSYLMRQQRNQMPSYFNLQLQQQLSSVLKSKQGGGDTLDYSNGGKSSPALEAVLELPLGLSAGNYLAGDPNSDQVPPPHYVYCTDSSTSNGLQQPSAISSSTTNNFPQQDPSIYSQVTKLQQVNTSNGAGFYGLHQQQWQQQQQEPLYSTQQEQQQHQYNNHQQHQQQDISEV